MGTQVLHRVLACREYLGHNHMCLYALLVVNFGNVENLFYNVWSQNIQFILCAIPNSAVELYYARKIYLVSQSIIFPVIIVVLVLFGNILAFYFTAKEFAVKQLGSFTVALWLRLLGLSSSVLGDILIAAMMCWSLYRKKTGFARTDSIIMTLMAYSINSGLVTSCLGIAMIISSAIAPNSMIPTGIFWVMCKCYSNTLLALLNNRDYIRERSTTDPDNSFNLTSIRYEPPTDKYPGVSVTVHRSTEVNLGVVRDKSDHSSIGPTLEVPPRDSQNSKGGVVR